MNKLGMTVAAGCLFAFAGCAHSGPEMAAPHAELEPAPASASVSSGPTIFIDGERVETRQARPGTLSSQPIIYVDGVQVSPPVSVVPRPTPLSSEPIIYVDGVRVEPADPDQ